MQVERFRRRALGEGVESGANGGMNSILFSVSSEVQSAPLARTSTDVITQDALARASTEVFQSSTLASTASSPTLSTEPLPSQPAPAEMAAPPQEIQPTVLTSMEASQRDIMERMPRSVCI